MNYAIDNGIINISDIQSIKNMKDKNKVLESHPYSIWQARNGTYNTYVPDKIKAKGVALRKRDTREALNQAIIDYYTKNPEYFRFIISQNETKNKKERRINAPKDCFKKIFEELKSYKKDVIDVSDNTIDKYTKDYDRFFKDTIIESVSIKSMDDEYLIKYINCRINTLKLTKRQGNDMINYIKMTLDRGLKKKVITENPFIYIDKSIFNKHYLSKKIQEDGERIVSDYEMAILNKRFEYYHEKKPRYIPIYAVELASLTGFRSGELAALRWDKIKDSRICIDSSEKYNRKSKEYYIDDTKNKKHRYYPITEEIQTLLKKLYETEKKYGYLSEYVFSNEDGRVHCRTISDCARNASIYIGLNSKSIHAYRRTVSSKMKCSGVATPIVASLMGHTEEVNDNHYTYDVSSDQQKCDIVSKVNKEIKHNIA